MTSIKNSVALVTGANRGIGKAFVEELLARGAAKVYATARTPLSYDDPRVVALPLDVTDESSVRAVAEQAKDAQIVINNAGIMGAGTLLNAPIDEIHKVIDTNLYGPIRVVQAFAPALKNNGGGTVVNVASVLSWLPSADYGVSKAAIWSASNHLRNELADQGTTVQSLHLGYTDTDMVANVDAPKNDPRDVAIASLDGVESGASEVLADDLTRGVKSQLSGVAA
jgi:NAD(P)-dependent dehydrogenase (short-subunit alcohol dehydrogenase family)